MAWVALAALLGYAFLDATAPRGVAYWQQAYVALFAGLCLLLVASAVANRGVIHVPARAQRPILTWLLVGTAYLAFVPGDEPVYPLWIAGDYVATVAFPLAWAILGFQAPRLFSSPRKLAAITLVLFAWACAAPVTTHLWGIEFARGIEGARFDPPSSLLIACMWTFVFASRARTRLLATGGIAVLLALGVLSQERTGPILWLGGLLYVFLVSATSRDMPRTWRRLAATGIVVSMTGLSLWAVTTDVRAQASWSRFERIIHGSDKSTVSRLAEGNEVLLKLTEVRSTPRWVVGFGHGATLEPRFVFPERNLTQSGDLHTIHIGPFLVLHRYGLVGLAFLGLLLAVPIRAFRALRRKPDPHDSAGWMWGVALNAALMLACAEFLVRNVQNDPLVSFVIGGTLSRLWSSPRAPGGRTLPASEAGQITHPIPEAGH